MRLTLDARSRALLRRLPSLNVYSVAEIVLLGLLAVQVARLTWVLATPVSPVGDWRPAGPAVAGSPFEIVTGFDPFYRLSGAQDAGTVTALQLTLFGTRIDEATGRGSAIIAGPDKVQQSVSVGDEVAPGARLKSVAFDHVVIARGAADENLYLDQSGAPPSTAGTSDGAAAPQAGEGTTVERLRREIAFTPRLDGARVNGLIVRPAGTGRLFREAQLRDGDVITAIGGRPVQGPEDIERVTTDFANGGTIPIIVERGRDTLPLAITIAPPQ